MTAQPTEKRAHLLQVEPAEQATAATVVDDWNPRSHYLQNRLSTALGGTTQAFRACQEVLNEQGRLYGHDNWNTLEVANNKTGEGAAWLKTLATEAIADLTLRQPASAAA
jgi:hypothetical protein